jgi:magnesium-transporting ATPase (P-type)
VKIRRKKSLEVLSLVSKNNKRGSLAMVWMLTSIVFVFVFILISLFAYKGLSEINTDLQADDDIQQIAKDNLGDLNTRFPLTFDALVVLVLVLLWVAVMVFAFFSDNHPIFYALFFIIIVFLLILGGIFSNVWDEVKTDSEMSTLALDFPKANYIMDNYLLFVGVICFSGLIAMFVKNRLLE